MAWLTCISPLAWPRPWGALNAPAVWHWRMAMTSAGDIEFTSAACKSGQEDWADFMGVRRGGERREGSGAVLSGGVGRTAVAKPADGQCQDFACFLRHCPPSSGSGHGGGAF